MSDENTNQMSSRDGKGNNQPPSLYDLERMCRDNNKALCELNAGLLGTIEKPGLITMIRNTHDTVMEVKKNQDNIKKDVDALKETKVRLIGLMMGSALSGGGVSVAALKFLGIH